MSADVGPELPFSWAATLLLYSGDIRSHLKEFDDIFPGLGRQITIEREQSPLLGRHNFGFHATHAADQPIEADTIMGCDGDQCLQAGGVLAVFDVCDV